MRAKFDQIAFYAENKFDVEKIKAMFGLTDAVWIKDTVDAKSAVCGGGFDRNVAQLEFNYDLGIELEIITYLEGPHWHEINPLCMSNSLFLSHVGLHLEDGEEFPVMEGCKLVQETFTDSHTSEMLVQNGRKYHYKIFEVSPGTYVKYIRRIHKEA